MELMKKFSLSSDNLLSKDKLIFKKYKPLKMIGIGSFGKVYNVQDMITKKIYAMKTELLTTTEKHLQNEAYYLLSLQGFGIPKFITYGHTKLNNILIEELLGKSLDFIFNKENIICRISDACLIAIQLIERLQWIHSKNVIYRDLKPQNLLIGKHDPNVIYIVDFGLCMKYRSSKTGKHILPKRTGKFSGNMRFSSINALIGKEQSRRDDLISLGYNIIFFVKKNLPWKYDLNYFDRDLYLKLVKDKRTNGNGSLYKNIPEEFQEYMKYTMNLKFEQEPDYEYLKSIFKNLLFKKKLDMKNICFGWINSNDKKLVGYPVNKFSRRSNSHRRIMNELKENSLKRIRQGKSEENILRNNKLNKEIYIPNYKVIKDKPKIDINKTLENTGQLKQLYLRNVQIIKNNRIKSSIGKENNNNINKQNLKFYKLKNISNLIRDKSEKRIINNSNGKLKRLIFEPNNYYKSKSKIINFNKQNVTKKNSKLKVININSINNSQVSKDSIFNCNDLTELNNTRFESPFEYEDNDMINYSPIKKKINFIKVKFLNKNKLYNKSNIINAYVDNINLANNTIHINKINNKNNDLIHNRTTQNVGIMIINNYKIKERNKSKKLYPKK